MARLLVLLAALLLAMPAIADDDNEGRGGEKKALRADCERQANQQNLIGKERRKFVKECSKEGKHAKRRGDGRGERRDVIVRPAPTQPAQPATQPATPAAPPPATTTPPQPAATPASPPPATTPAATPQPPKPVLTAEQKRANCADEAKRANVLIPARKQYIDKCMAR